MYIPEGVHSITPTIDGKAGSIVSKVEASRGEFIVEALNKALAKRESNNVRPIVDFDHMDTGPAAAIPKKFSYVEGEGVMLEVDWTDAGNAAVKGRNYSYFSPVYNIHRDTGEPVGLPDSGPIGALVNDPAFRDIKRIAASKAAEPIIHEMDTTALIKAGLVTEAEAKTDKVADIVTANIQEIQAKAAKVEGLETQVSTLKASLAKVAETTADRTIDDAVKTGRIAAKDESVKGYWRSQLIEASNDEEKLAQVSAALHAIPANDILKKEVEVKAGENKGMSKESRVEASLSKARADLGATAQFQAVWEHAQTIDPSAFAE